MPTGAGAGPCSARSPQLSTFTADASAALRGPAWLRARRAEAFERFAAAALPTPAEEIWRYSRIDQLDLDAFAPLPPDGDSARAAPAELAPVLDAVGDRAGLVVVRNGRLASVELAPGLAERGVVVQSLGELPDGDEVLGAVAGPADPFVDLSTAFLADGLVVRVPPRVVVRDPIVVVHWLDDGADAGAVFPRLVVTTGEGAQVTVLDHVGGTEGAGALVAPVVELDAADASHLGYLALQELGRQSWQIGYQASRVGRDATLASSVVALGGGYARVRADSRLVGQGGESYLLAAYFGDGGQMHDFRTEQDHAAPKTTSDLLFKGAVEDEAHAVYSGLIRVRKGASGTNAIQTNRNLVLTEGARADSVPNLEIEENDVRCAHASAVGPVDEDQLYYLEARGVPPEVAERLIVLGFFDEVILHRQAPVPGLAGRLRAAVAAKLAGHR